MATILLAIGVPLAVVALGAITKLVWDMKSVIAADAVRWEQQAEKWDANTADHVKAFAAIDDVKEEMKTGHEEIKIKQAEISGKLDLLIGREE